MPRRHSSTIDRFTELLAEHVDEEDIRVGRGRVLDPGGDLLKVSRALGLEPVEGTELLQRIRRKYGRQAA